MALASQQVCEVLRCRLLFYRLSFFVSGQKYEIFKHLADQIGKKNCYDVQRCQMTSKSDGKESEKKSFLFVCLLLLLLLPLLLLMLFTF